MYNLQLGIIRIRTTLQGRLAREEGQAMIEYALILALISVVTIAVLRLIGVSVNGLFNTVNSALSAAQT